MILTPFFIGVLFTKFGCENCAIIRLSGPLKERYALENNLDYQKLLDASEYKEIFRQKMIKWGEDYRIKDPGYFCRHAIIQSGANSKKIWIVSDARRKSDIKFFLNNFATVTYTIRIAASDFVRQQRGWKFSEGVDDCESECGLDDYNSWDFFLSNDDETQLRKGLENIYSLHSIKEILNN
ncbi:phosphomevalonate kinase isoform X2 [Parasteatoda tepidariorum]|uniref:phosphomevalonate kinase isoform X2 n=1 Tax=Parasteatoda tepidariorum TaxID=114398 RepID=UPI00077FB96D|nr:phosphomevalonate kinase isoform X2 [Parasteatoda tepidariorum]